MQDEQAFLKYLLEHPSDWTARLAFADWFEERADPRHELIRLQHTLTKFIDVPNRSALEQRQRDLLNQGVKPVGPFFTLDLPEGQTMTFACIPAGTFLMGSPETEEHRENDEKLHEVTLTKPFFLAIHPVTQEQWEAVMGFNPSRYRGIRENLPVDQVSWEACMEFCANLSEQVNQEFTLPTEAQLEYACRAGTTTPFFFGDTISPSEANYDGKQAYRSGQKGGYRDEPTVVGSFGANAWGLHDMHGNVCEWCLDWFGDQTDIPDKCVDPLGPTHGSIRVIRGGSWSCYAAHCRSAMRGRYDPARRGTDLGLRLLSFSAKV